MTAVTFKNVGPDRRSWAARLPYPWARFILAEVLKSGAIVADQALWVNMHTGEIFDGMGRTPVGHFSIR